MKIITLCSIGLFFFVFFSAVEFEYMFLHLTSFNKLSTEWSQSDKMLCLTDSTENNSSAHLDNFLFPLNHYSLIKCFHIPVVLKLLEFFFGRRTALNIFN